MTFAAPLFVWAAGAAALLAAVLHLLAWRRPPATPLPTARFAPDVPVRTVSRALRPSDLALLALRVALLLLVGAALGRPTLRSRQAGTGRVVVVDQSGGPRVGAAVADSARSHFRPGDVVVTFDSSAREVSQATADSILPGSGPRMTGSVSAGLVVAIRAARRLARERDSVEIVVVSPFEVDELDAATTAIRQAWRGPIRGIRAVVPPNDSTPAGRVVVRAVAGDPVAAALALSNQARPGGDVRVVRVPLDATDTAWASQGHTVVAWPASLAAAGWPPRARPDTAFAVATVGAPAAALRDAAAATVVAPLARAIGPPPGRVVARWQDGEPAATENALGSGCVRSVAVAVPPAGDLALTPAFRRFVERLTVSCGRGSGAAAVSDRVLASVLNPAPAAGDETGTLGGIDAPVSRLTAWLLGLALVAGLAELALRRGVNATA